MKRELVLMLGGLALSGCCAGMHGTVRAFGSDLESFSGQTIALIEQCKAGDEPACDSAKRRLELIRDGAHNMAQGRTEKQAE